MEKNNTYFGKGVLKNKIYAICLSLSFTSISPCPTFPCKQWDTSGVCHLPLGGKSLFHLEWRVRCLLVGAIQYSFLHTHMHNLFPDLGNTWTLGNRGRKVRKSLFIKVLFWLALLISGYETVIAVGLSGDERIMKAPWRLWRFRESMPMNIWTYQRYNYKQKEILYKTH